MLYYYYKEHLIFWNEPLPTVITNWILTEGQVQNMASKGHMSGKEKSHHCQYWHHAHVSLLLEKNVHLMCSLVIQFLQVHFEHTS